VKRVRRGKARERKEGKVKGRVKRKRIENKEKNEDAMVAVTCIQGAISLILFTDLREAEYRSV
jgi:hypothetical protein